MLDSRTDKSKAVLLGRRQLYAVPSRSPAKIAILGITRMLLKFRGLCLCLCFLRQLQVHDTRSTLNPYKHIVLLWDIC